MRSRTVIWTGLAMCVCTCAFAQQSAGTTTESHKYRTMFTFIGLGGGAAAGLFIGLSRGGFVRRRLEYGHGREFRARPSRAHRNTSVGGAQL